MPKTTSPSTSRRAAPRITQPAAMKTKAYVYGVDKLNGSDAWAMFKACAANDAAKVKSLLAKDKRLVNAQGGQTWAEQANGLFRLWISFARAG